MASSRRADRNTALEEYIKPLDERFSDHPYREQTQKWRDQILLEDAESRGKNLTSGLDISLTPPDSDAERKFVIAHEPASGAHGRGDDLTAIRQWQEFAQQVKPDDPDERKWHLLARHRISQIENEITDRRQFIEKQLELAKIAYGAGRHNEALMIKRKLIEQFSQFTDLADIFGPTVVAPGSAPQTPASAESTPGEKTDSSKPSPPKEPAEPPATATPPNVSPDRPPTADPKHDQAFRRSPRVSPSRRFRGIQPTIRLRIP